MATHIFFYFPFLHHFFLFLFFLFIFFDPRNPSVFSPEVIFIHFPFFKNGECENCIHVSTLMCHHLQLLYSAFLLILNYFSFSLCPFSPPFLFLGFELLSNVLFHVSFSYLFPPFSFATLHLIKHKGHFFPPWLFLISRLLVIFVLGCGCVGQL